MLPDPIEPDDVYARSRASAEFKAALRMLARGQGADRVTSARTTPPVKAERVITHLLWAEPELEVERVHIDGWSGCSDFVGAITVATPAGERVFEFAWDCRWRAEQEGWFDFFGQPDQIRAARTFGWRCMAAWRERSAAPAGG